MEHQASGNFLSNLLVLGQQPKTVRHLKETFATINYLND
jgi:hypothetical protein